MDAKLVGKINTGPGDENAMLLAHQDHHRQPTQPEAPSMRFFAPFGRLVRQRCRSSEHRWMTVLISADRAQLSIKEAP
jgi:hypothetical protein